MSIVATVRVRSWTRAQAAGGRQPRAGPAGSPMLATSAVGMNTMMDAGTSRSRRRPATPGLHRLGAELLAWPSRDGPPASRILATLAAGMKRSTLAPSQRGQGKPAYLNWRAPVNSLAN